MNEQMILEIIKKELTTLKEFLDVLREERDAIISFSLEGIVRESNRKEEILKRIEFLENEKERLLEDVADKEAFFKGSKWSPVTGEIKKTMNEINTSMGKNMKLMSFSMDHVKSSIESVVNFINQATYGKRQDRISLLAPRKI